MVEITTAGSLAMAKVILMRVAALLSPFIVAPGLYLLAIVLSERSFPSEALFIWVVCAPFIAVSGSIVFGVSYPFLRKLTSSIALFVYGACSGIAAAILILLMLAFLVPIDLAFVLIVLVVGIASGMLSAVLWISAGQGKPCRLEESD